MILDRLLAVRDGIKAGRGRVDVCQQINVPAKVLRNSLRDYLGTSKWPCDLAAIDIAIAGLRQKLKQVKRGAHPSGQWHPAAVHLQVLDETAAAFYVTRADIIGRMRHPRIVQARQAACWVLRRRMRLSYTQIAAVISQRDHSTMIYSFAKAEKLRREDEYFRSLTDLLLAGAPELDLLAARRVPEEIILAAEQEAARRRSAAAIVDGLAREWCIQCERRVSPSDASACKSRFCQVRHMADGA